MKYLYVLFFVLLVNFSFAQSSTNTDYKNIQGKWVCITPQYKKHTFWVKDMSFFQKDRQYVLEQGLPYEIKKYNHQEQDIGIVGLFVKCNGCYDDLWIIKELTSVKLVLENYQTEEIAEYKKVIAKSKK